MFDPLLFTAETPSISPGNSDLRGGSTCENVRPGKYLQAHHLLHRVNPVAEVHDKISDNLLHRGMRRNEKATAGIDFAGKNC